MSGQKQDMKFKEYSVDLRDRIMWQGKDLGMEGKKIIFSKALSVPRTVGAIIVKGNKFGTTRILLTRLAI